MAITFSYSNPIDKKTHKLALRVDPYNVEWEYNLNTQTYDTYGGQVVQVLSVNVNNLTIDGQFGREGPFGVHKNANRKPVTDPRWGGKVEHQGWVTNNTTEQHAYKNAKYPGLYQMATFFSDYFSVSSQGGDAKEKGKFIQIPMKIVYDAGPYPTAASDAGSHGQTSVRHWEAFPNNFPAFSRSNEEFAPLWKVEFSVYQADPHVEFAIKNDAIHSLSRIRGGIGWEAENPWIDPAANPKDPPGLVTKKLVSEYKNFLPKLTKGDLNTMIWQGISLPAIEGGIPMNKIWNQFGDDKGTTHDQNPTVPKKAPND